MTTTYVPPVVAVDASPKQNAGYTNLVPAPYPPGASGELLSPPQNPSPEPLTTSVGPYTPPATSNMKPGVGTTVSSGGPTHKAPAKANELPYVQPPAQIYAGQTFVQTK